jgi:hypothetical protein
MTVRDPRRLLQGLFLALCSYFVLWACAPAASLRPPVPFAEGQSNEVGLGASYTQGLSEVPQGELSPPSSGFSGMLWYGHQFSERFDLGVTIFGGQTSLLGGGLDLRYYLVRQPRLRVGIGLEGGWLWGAVNVPIGFALSEKIWMYVSPSVGMRYSDLIRVPVGLSVPIGKHFVLVPEVGVGWGGSEISVSPLKYFKLYGAVAGTARF